jgi:hypothetical protein
MGVWVRVLCVCVNLLVELEVNRVGGCGAEVVLLSYELDIISCAVVVVSQHLHKCYFVIVLRVMGYELEYGLWLWVKVIVMSIPVQHITHI